MKLIDYNEEFEAIVEAYEKVGGDKGALIDRKTGSLVINGTKVLGKNETEGLRIEHRAIKDGVKVKVHVDAGTKIERPVHLCFGVLPRKGRQVIKSEFFIGDNASVKFIAHCVFPNAESVEHIMDSLVHIGEGADMSYVETHYHSESGGTFVYPKLRGEIGTGGALKEEFKLTEGRVGTLKIDYEIEQEERSTCELLTKVFGKGKDEIEVREALHLNGAHAAGTAKSRIVLTDAAFGNVLGEVVGKAPYTRGHIDCHEVVHGKDAKAVSTPMISVDDPLAKVTHEAAIGRINKKELETLMARGLTEEEAVDFIVQGLLR